MSGTGAPVRPATADEGSERPCLRLVATHDERPHTSQPTLHDYADRVLVAGGDPARRARMLAELRSLLPSDTDFCEAGETWEVIAQACESRMVVLAGDLGETSASSLLRLLARRNPSLPVLAVGGERRLNVSPSGSGADDDRHCPTLDAAHA